MISMVKKGKINILKMTLGSMSTNTYLVFDEDKNGFLVDPGDSADTIKIKVTEIGVAVKALILTHGHFDHIGALSDVRKLYDAKVYAMSEEETILTSSENNLSMYFGGAFTEKADIYLSDNEEFEIGNIHIKAIRTPGHTVGSTCYLLNCEGEEALLSGDTIFAGSFGRYDFPTGNYKDLIVSIRDRLMILPEDLEVFPGHGEDTTIGDEKPKYEQL